MYVIRITDGAHNTPKLEKSGWPYITAKDIRDDWIDFSNKNYISEKEHRELYLKCRPQSDDILIINIGASYGRAALIDTDIEFSFKNIAILKPGDKLIPKYLLFNQMAYREKIFADKT